MTIWTTFCPSKVCWELTYVQTKGTKPTSSWLKQQNLIINSLKLLKEYGISGIRLVIFPHEITQDGKTFDWTAIDTLLMLCKKQQLLVDLCIGPYQYPYYPGIYLPPKILNEVRDNDGALDDDATLYEYGHTFLQTQLERYGRHTEINGFHFANEWPDRQVVSGKEPVKKAVSEAFMLSAAACIKEATGKPIRLNTNIDARDTKKLKKTFTKLLTIFGNQGSLGLDIYPSQETWQKVPWQKLRSVVQSYRESFSLIQREFPSCKLYFAEVEAQPWGNGRAWYTIITNEFDPQKKVLTYSSHSLQQTWDAYIKRTNCDMISLWGSDFWLVAHAMGITWPLEKVKLISSQDA